MVLQRPNYFIISGGPGSGKTSIVDRLDRRGFTTVGESGRAIIREQAAAGGNATHTGDAAAFGELMLARGIAELVGYWRLIGLPVPAHVAAAAAEYRSNPTVFLTPPWREIYRQDAERQQDWDEAVRTFELVRDAYTEAGYTTVELPRAPLAERIAFVLAHVDAAT